MKDVFIFSGTTEGRSLARWLASCGVMVHVRVATDYGAEVMESDPNIDVQVGSCGGAEGIARVISENMYEIVVDATHPYATTVSKHIREGCEASGAEYIRLRRADSDIGGSDGIVTVDSVDDAVTYLMDRSGTILAATGSKELDRYTRIPDYKDRVVARVLSTMDSVTRAVGLGFEGRNLICAQGPFSEDVNYATLRQIGAEYIVTKDSGTVGGYEEKVRAARRSGATVVLVRKPDDTGLPYDEVVNLLREKLDLPDAEAAPVPEGRRRVVLIGIGMGPGDMTVRATEKVRSADLVIGAKRMLEAVDTSGKDVYAEYRSDLIADYIDSHPENRDVAILLSGDVGFYSGATKLLSAIDSSRYDVEVEAGISSVVYLCSKIGETWQDAYLTSAHGRSSNIVGLVATHPKVFTLLSGNDSVHSICRGLFDYGLNNVEVTIGQDFGYPTERIITGTPSEILAESFGDLCVALIVNRTPDTGNPIGIPDEAFVRGDAPMTKSEVRALSVAKLRLSPDSVVYDVGAGTGSVSVEMALTACNGTVYAIEKEEAAANLIDINRKRFKTANLEIVRGLAPEALESLPAPTHAFIGGSSGNLKQIVQCLLEKNPDVRIVINSVTVETMGETLQVIKELGLVEEELVNITVARSRRLGRYHLMTGQNPVYIAVVRGR